MGYTIMAPRTILGDRLGWQPAPLWNHYGRYEWDRLNRRMVWRFRG